MKKLRIFTMLCVMLAILLVSSYAIAQQYPGGMVSYWKLDEGSGTTAYDSVDANHGTIYGATWTTGIVDGALSFSGADYVEVPHSANINPSYITVEAWIYPTSYGYYRSMVLKRYHSGWSYPYFLFMFWLINDTAQPAFNIVVGGTPYGANSDEAIPMNQWTHLVGTYDGPTVKIYVNGVLKKSIPGPGGPLDYTTQPLYIGRTVASNHSYYGKIDEVAIYNRALSAEEIQQHYQNGLIGAGYEAITIDIKPGSDPNSINLKSKGVVPVAVLTTDDFDASDVDPTTVEFAGAEPVRWVMEDVDGDGDVDMLFHFKTQELVDLDEDSTEATLIAYTYDPLNRLIEGKDTVNIVPKGKGNGKK